ncbi:MAG: hypothetical protein WD772_03215, partial [Pseudohongiellaceae bacterium]
ATGAYPADQIVFQDLVNGVYNGGVSPLPAWFTANNWLAASNYSRVDNDNAAVNFNGCSITYGFSFAVTAITRNTSLC